MIAVIKRFIKKQKKMFAIITFMVLSFSIAGVCFMLNVRGGNNLTSPIPAAVQINGNEYTSTNKYKVLEIVPQAGLSEIGYLVGDSKIAGTDNFTTNMPVSYEDIKALKKAGASADEIKAVTEKVKMATMVAIGDKRYTYSDYSDDFTSIAGYGDRNIFAYGIMKNSNMTDKVEVRSIPAAEVTATDVDNADFIYINPGGHTSDYASAWNTMTSLVNKYNTSISPYMKSKYVSTASSKVFSSDNNAYNIKADVALEIYKRAAQDGVSLVFDNSKLNTTPEAMDSYSILGIMILGIDKNAFSTEYMQTRDTTSTNVKYTGTKGYVQATVTSGSGTTARRQLDLYNSGTKIKWDAYMFITLNNGKLEYPYFNACGNGRNIIYVSGSIMSYSGYNLMEMVFQSDGTSNSDFDSSGKYIGTDFELAKAKYGVDSNGKLLNSTMVAYIVGAPVKFRTINVFEIEPSGAKNYNNYAGAVKIMEYFGYNTDDMTQTNYSEYVKVKVMPTNGFNGMNEDLSEIYDLIIVGTHNTDGKNTFLKSSTPGALVSTIYTKKAETVSVDYPGSEKSVKFSGNDLTEKSLNKIKNYIKNRKPILLSEPVYNGTKTLIDETSNVYKLSASALIKEGLPLSNVVSDVAGKTPENALLRRIVMPEVSVSDSKFNLSYTGTSSDLAKATVSTTELSSLPFFGKIGDDSRSYDVVVYMDRDGNGIYADESTDDRNEVFYNNTVTTDQDGNFKVILNIPEATRGYLAWKVVVKDKGTAVKTETTGGFVIKVEDSDIKTVKVLQIYPTDNSSSKDVTLMLDDPKFMKLFSDTASVSGLKLAVTKVSSNEYQNWFAAKHYTKGVYNVNNRLSDYSIVVLGFGDTYLGNDISNDFGALDNIKDYIEKGNAVLFAHDTTTFRTYTDGTGNIIPGSWCNNLTINFRSMIGMDRFGAMKSVYKASDYVQGISNETLLRFGYLLDRYNKKIPYSIFGGYSIASLDTLIETDTVKKLNKGQITEFPYKTSETLPVAKTHAQYFQLNLESYINELTGKSDVSKDVVVWYTLAASTTSGLTEKSSYYNYAGQDALNSYYIYSKGNITYSGAGHSSLSGDNELKLFVNTVIKAIMSGNSIPVVKITNGVAEAPERYAVYERADDVNSLPAIKFMASDADLSVNIGQFKTAEVYWDVNENGNYDAGDVVLHAYSAADPVKNCVETSFNLTPYMAIKYASNGPTLDQVYRSKGLKIGVRVSDALDSYGNAVASVYYRQLFNLK